MNLTLRSHHLWTSPHLLQTLLQQLRSPHEVGIGSDLGHQWNWHQKQICRRRRLQNWSSYQHRRKLLPVAFRAIARLIYLSPVRSCRKHCKSPSLCSRAKSKPTLSFGHRPIPRRKKPTGPNRNRVSGPRPARQWLAIYSFNFCGEKGEQQRLSISAWREQNFIKKGSFHQANPASLTPVRSQQVSKYTFWAIIFVCLTDFVSNSTLRFGKASGIKLLADASAVFQEPAIVPSF